MVQTDRKVPVSKLLKFTAVVRKRVCLRAHSHLALLSRTMPKHECLPSPLPRWPAPTLLQSKCTWARLNFLIYRVRPVFLPAFFSPFNNILKSFSGSRDLQNGHRFFHCFSCGHCLLLSAWMWGESSANSHNDVGAQCLCSCTCVHTVLKSTSSNGARADKACCAWVWNGLSH